MKGNLAGFVGVRVQHWDTVGVPPARREWTRRPHVYALHLSAHPDGRRQLGVNVQHLDDYWGGLSWVTHTFTEQPDGTVVTENTGNNYRQIIADPRRYGAELNEAWVRAYLGEHHTVPPIAPTSPPEANTTLLALMAAHSSIRAEAYHWVDDCFGDAGDKTEAIMSATSERIVQTIERHYEGGVSEFLAAAAPLLDAGGVA